MSSDRVVTLDGHTEPVTVYGIKAQYGTRWHGVVRNTMTVADLIDDPAWRAQTRQAFLAPRSTIWLVANSPEELAEAVRDYLWKQYQIEYATVRVVMLSSVSSVAAGAA